METLFLFENGKNGAIFFELYGDHSRFVDVFINSALPKGSTLDKDEYEGLQEELCAIVYDEEGEIRPKRPDAPTKDWDFFFRCGFLD